jgi:hypothetical protein
VTGVPRSQMVCTCRPRPRAGAQAAASIPAARAGASVSPSQSGRRWVGLVAGAVWGEGLPACGGLPT